jgi:choline dehydrogenase
VYIQPAPDPNPIAPAALEAARSVGIPTFENQNGRMMEGDGGASIIDVLVDSHLRFESRGSVLVVPPVRPVFV